MIHPEIPINAISVMQPWAWLIAKGYKPIENRDWKPWSPGLKYRGPVAIHTGQKRDKDAWDYVVAGIHPVTGARADHFDHDRSIEHLSGIVGVAEIIGCVESSDDEWFVGRYGLLIRNARPVPFIPVKGALGFFDWRKNLAKAAR